MILIKLSGSQERRCRLATLALAVVINWIIWFIMSLASYKTMPSQYVLPEIIDDLWQTALETVLLVELSFAYSRIIARSLWKAPHSFSKLLLQATILLLLNFLFAAIIGWIYTIFYPEMEHGGIYYRVMFCDGVTVYFVTSIYFMSYLLQRHREEEEKAYLAENESLRNKTIALQARLDKLAIQTNNHFVFNSLSTLESLIEDKPDEATLFLHRLSDIYRYLVRSSDANVVMIEEEINFTMQYMHLVNYRYSGIEVKADVNLREARGFLPPVSVQQLIENAVKHNRHGKNDTLKIRIFLRNGYIFVTNNILPLQNEQASSETGLKNLDDRYSLISEKKITVNNSSGMFMVGLPVLFVEDLKDEDFYNRR